MIHEEVMPDEVAGALVTDPRGLYIDATVSTGGHARVLLDRFPGIRLMGVDWDPGALDVARERLRPHHERVELLHANFARIPEILAGRGERSVCGLLADVGLSSYALEDPERGYSYRFPGAPLDMRCDRSEGIRAAEALARWTEQDLERVFRTLADIRASRRLARGLAAWRGGRPMETVGDLVEGVRQAMGGRAGPGLLSKVFQAIRLEFHGDLEHIDRLVTGIGEHVVGGGRLVLLCYQSLEMRTVRAALRRLRERHGRPVWTPLMKSSQAPSREEIRRNPRARSARLSAYRKAGGS